MDPAVGVSLQELAIEAAQCSFRVRVSRVNHEAYFHEINIFEGSNNRAIVQLAPFLIADGEAEGHTKVVVFECAKLRDIHAAGVQFER